MSPLYLEFSLYYFVIFNINNKIFLNKNKKTQK